MTTTYRHAPGHYRTTAADLAAHLVAIADHLDAVAAAGGNLTPVDVGPVLDQLTDAVVDVERLAALADVGLVDYLARMGVTA
jgi:hypothetical protein